MLEIKASQHYPQILAEAMGSHNFAPPVFPEHYVFYHLGVLVDFEVVDQLLVGVLGDSLHFFVCGGLLGGNLR